MSAEIHAIRQGKRAPAYLRVEAGLYLHVKSGIYYVRKTFRHLRIPDLFESLRETKITAARREAQRRIEAHKARYLGGKVQTERDERAGQSVGFIIDEMLITITPKRRKGTQQNQVKLWSELKEHWGQMDVNRLTLIMWERWLVGFKADKGKRDPKTGKRRATFNDYVFKMNHVLRYAYNHRYLKHPLVLPPTDPVRGETGRVYTDGEMASLWGAMNETMRDQFVLAFECFMRLREVLYLTWERIDIETGRLVLRPEDVKTGSRTGKGRTFFISPNALSRLQRRYSERGESPYVFPSRDSPNAPQEDNKTAWAGAKKRAGIKGRARWHDIRHTSLTKALLEQKLNPIEVSEYAGVSMRTIQKVYLHSNEERTRSIAGALSVSVLSSGAGSVKKV